MHVTVKETKDKEENRMVKFRVYKTRNKAEQVKAILEQAIKKVQGNDGNMDLDAWNNACDKNNIKLKNSRGNGDIKTGAYADNAVLITTYLAGEEDEDLTLDNAMFKVIDIVAGQTEYDVTIAGSGDMSSGTHKLDNLDVTSKQKDTIVTKTYPPIDDGKTMTFRIHIEMPAGTANENSRLVVQPMSVDCQTEDTVDYIKGLVYEGPLYHEEQHKYMKFNYMKYDNVAPAFVNIPLLSFEKVYIDTTLTYQKPKEEKIYKIPFKTEIADFNHVFYSHTAATGSCNPKRIFKFLELGQAAATMNVDEYEVIADDNFETRDRDLHLKFEVGKSVMSADSLNQVQLTELVEELRSYGETLNEVTVAATASPDGGQEKNRSLATERTAVAARNVKGYLGKADLAFHTAQPKVYTWGDVADVLVDKGYDELATQVRGAMGANGFGGDDAIKRLEGYQDIIVPVLEDLRIMRVTYRVERDHKYTPQEALEEFIKRKPDLLSGKGKDLSDGDYYNLYTMIYDPAERDTLTMIAYKHVISQSSYQNIKFSAYVANEMAILNLKRGLFDHNVLKPFITTRTKRLTKRERKNTAQKNRYELVVNQIMTFCQMEKRDSALNYLDHFFPQGSELYDDPKVVSLRQFITFKDNFVKYGFNQLPADKSKEVYEAMQFVYGCAPDNEAVIKTEGRDIINASYDDCLKLINGMDDNNPKKWYLRGIIEADKEEKNLKTQKKKGYIPNYLCFFNHSFDLDPHMKWNYFNEGQVSDDLRAVFKWKKGLKDEYRKQFSELVTLKQSDGSGPLTEFEAPDFDDEEETPAADSTDTENAAPAEGTDGAATTETNSVQ